MGPELGHQAHDVVHWAATLVLAGGGAAILALATRRGRRASTPAVPPTAGRATVEGSVAQVLAGLSLGAAAIHLVAAPAHYREYGDLGAGFVVAAAFQAAWARAWLTRPTRRTAWLGLAGNAAIVVAWAWSRTAGLPFPGQVGAPEPIGLPDGAATVFEVLVVGTLAAHLAVHPAATERRLARRVAAGRVQLAARAVVMVGVVPVLGLILLTTSLAAVAIAAGLDHGLPVGAAAAGAAHGH